MNMRVRKSRRLACTEALRKLMADHFLEMDEASEGGTAKVAWCTSVGPAELLRAMGFLVYFPENHAAMLGATRKATDCISIANANGYAPEICSYLTSDIGAYIKNETPLSFSYGIKSVPRPDVLVYNTNQCRDVKDWFMWYSRRLAVPCFGIETFRNVDVVDEDKIAAILAQHVKLTTLLEEVGGDKLDMDRLREVIGLSRECSLLWERVLDTAKTTPSPFSFFDGLIHMAPAVVARGTKMATDYYQLLLDELNGRVKHNAAAVEGEKHRIYWDGMPVWGKIRDQSNLFTKLKTCVVASNYCNAWILSSLDPHKPFESMARAYTELFIVRSDQVKEQIMAKNIQDYGIDGVVFHDAKTCPNNSNGRYGMAGRLAKKLGIPTVTFSGDLNDLRFYSEEQTVTLIEAFVEQLEGI
jgi:benzoyl-CoA reductase/2-hydroxyglutaryl-CoA dehydratase subunit BcrC/BadD/HgdB